MSEEAAFLDALRKNPDDDVTRLVYADWLDEQGDRGNAAKSAFLRYQCQLAALPATTRIGGTRRRRLRRLANSVADADWLAVVSKPAIERCELKFAFRCPKQWDKLTATWNDAVRFCAVCQRDVYYCQTIPEALGHAAQGHCVAVNLSRRRRNGDLDSVDDALSLEVDEDVVVGEVDDSELESYEAELPFGEDE
jgi:uncharacterized protein (TIGR02996 family)